MAIIRAYLLIALFWGAWEGAQGANLRVSVLQEIVGFGAYAHLTNGSFKGEMATVFDCVADQLNVQVSYKVAPAKRGIHDIRVGEVDLLLPIPVVDDIYHRWQGDLVFSEVLHPGYWLLVHRAQQSVSLEPPFEGVTLGMYYRAAYHERFDEVTKVSVNSHFQLYRLLISGRINLISVFQPWSADQVRQYEGHKLAAHSYRYSPYRVGISRKSPWSSDELKSSLNMAITACRHSFRLGERSPF
mgnify:CR=1 FL=1